mgnify:CR=1 FL=1
MKFELFILIEPGKTALLSSCSDNYGAGWSEWRDPSGKICFTTDAPEGWAATEIRISGGSIEKAMETVHRQIETYEEWEKEGKGDKEQLEFLRNVARCLPMFS